MDDTDGPAIAYNTDEWIKENKKYFNPPVCNKMMHNEGQMKVFYVGGPNQRKDYHIEEGEELFYMLKGDMCLKVVEQGKHRDVPIKEGEIFLLPAKIAHSPQRKEDTIGLVIERDRAENEKDGLRYYTEENGVATLNSLYEEWFHCEDLGTQLAPIINRYFASEECKTGIPKADYSNPPFQLDSKRKLEDPFNLMDWIAKNKAELGTNGGVKMFEKEYQFQVSVYGKGENSGKCDTAETFVWQLVGSSVVTVEGKEYKLNQNDTLLVKMGKSYVAKGDEGSSALICYQDPTRKGKVSQQ